MEERKVPTVANEEGRIRRATPKEEAARSRVATMHIYQRRPAREEASRKKSSEEQQKGTPTKKADGASEGQEGRAVEPPRHRRRLLLDEEPNEEEDEVFFTLIEALPSSGHPTPHAKVEDTAREQSEMKGWGKPSPAQ